MSIRNLPTYDFSIADEPGTVAAKNFVSLFNPVGSGKLILFGGVFTSCSAFSSHLSPLTLRGVKITAASGGTLRPASDIAKFDSANHPDPAAQIRTDNPTVTETQRLLSHPAPTEKRASNVTQTSGFPNVRFYPGEGIVMRMTEGLTDLFWNISLVWSEV